MKALFLFALAALPLPVLAADDARDFSLDVPAADVEQLELEANVGEVDVVAADIDRVEVRVRLEPDDDGWFGSSKDLAQRLEDAELEHDVSGGILRLRLDYDDSGRGDNELEEHWEIRVPVRFETVAELNVGSMRIEGTKGGVEAEVNVGQLEIDVLGGDIDAEVNVGELAITSATESPGEFDLETNIGEATLRVDGERTGSRDGWLGNSVRHDADGDDDVFARMNVGEIRVEIR